VPGSESGVGGERRGGLQETRGGEGGDIDEGGDIGETSSSSFRTIIALQLRMAMTRDDQ
jgi:hypothetical protein